MMACCGYYCIYVVHVCSVFSQVVPNNLAMILELRVKDVDKSVSTPSPPPRPPQCRLIVLLCCAFPMQVEGRVMGSASENILKQSFGGIYSNELLAEGGLYSERPEPFSYISVEVCIVYAIVYAMVI